MKKAVRLNIKLFAALAFVAAVMPAAPAHATVCGTGGSASFTDIGGGQCRAFITSGTSLTLPTDWTTTNTIEVIGGGANGVTGSTGGTGTFGGLPSGSGATGGAGGGGGAYSKATNATTFTPGGSVAYAVGGVAGDTYFCNSTSNCASIAGSAVVAGAKGGSGTTGGSSASGVGATKYSGGNGASGTGGSATGNCNGGTGGNGGGGGGAAGLNGAGNAGSGSTGGSGDAGNTAAGANGTQWSASFGSGGGAAGGTSGGGGGSGDCGSFATNGTAGGAGAAGGLYGAGGSGGKGGGGGSAGYTFCSAIDPKFGSCVSFTQVAGGTGGTGGAGGAGRQGVIVLTYTPTVVVAPTVTTNSAGSASPTIATLFGAITATGGADATQSGFAYGTVSTLNTVIATTTLGAQSGTASFNSSVSGLSANTVYYYRAYATNSAGTGYGSILSFTTGNSTANRRIRLFEGFKIKFISGKIKVFGL